DLVLADSSVSRYHAELTTTAGGCRLAGLGSANGTFVNGQPITAAALAEGDGVDIGSVTFRLTGGGLQEFDGPGGESTGAEGTEAYSEVAAGYPEGAGPYAESPGPYADSPAPYAGDGPLEIPYAVRWLVPRGERFANFDILNDNDTQLAYYRKFGHVYAVGVPTKKWRLVVVSDPELLDQVAADEEQFGKRVEEINFFTQLSNSRGGGISVIGD